LASKGVGATLRQERVGKGLGIDDISRDTRIPTRFLEAIETEDYASLPGLVFTRNFVRQYALTLQLDPDPLLAELPKQDESTVPLPDPPARPKSSYRRERRVRSILSSVVWLLLLGGAGVAVYIHFNHLRTAARPPARATSSSQAFRPAPAAIEQTTQAVIEQAPAPVPETPAPAAPVQVSLTAREPAWIEVSADGRPTFSGTLMPNETKAVSAAEQVNVVTGNAGALTISLNGKTLESLGPLGKMREVKLTAEGPQFPSKAPQPEPDPL
jgi:cytoskeleton protein RodZ